jgi:hypothetical protein
MRLKLKSDSHTQFWVIKTRLVKEAVDKHFSKKNRIISCQYLKHAEGDKKTTTEKRVTFSERESYCRSRSLSALSISSTNNRSFFILQIFSLLICARTLFRDGRNRKEGKQVGSLSATTIQIEVIKKFGRKVGDLRNNACISFLTDGIDSIFNTGQCSRLAYARTRR